MRKTVRAGEKGWERESQTEKEALKVCRGPTHGAEAPEGAPLVVAYYLGPDAFAAADKDGPNPIADVLCFEGDLGADVGTRACGAVTTAFALRRLSVDGVRRGRAVTTAWLGAIASGAVVGALARDAVTTACRPLVSRRVGGLGDN